MSYDDDIGEDADPPAEASKAELEELLESLRAEHRRIDTEINALIETGVADMLKVQRMKKIKLSLKDQITFVENQITPDIIA
jgi:hypothetical protein